MSGPVDVLAVLDERISRYGGPDINVDEQQLREARAAVAELVETAKAVVLETGTSRVCIPSITSTDRLRAALARVQP